MPRRRWPVVVGALCVQICLGAIYAWGTFVPILKADRSELALMLKPDVLGIEPALHAQLSKEAKARKTALAQARGPEREKAKAAWTDFLATSVTPRLNLPESAWSNQLAHFTAVGAKSVFSVCLAVFSVVMIFSGRWQDRVGPRKVALFGVVLLAVSYLMASLNITSLPWVGFWIGVVGGIGIGCAYVCPIAACLKWYPDAKGLITGLAVAGFGAGAYLFINLAGSWAGLLSAGGVPLAFRAYGLIFLVVGGLGALLLSNPPGYDAAAAKAAGHDDSDLTQAECVRTRSFPLMWSAFMLSSGAGLLVISALKDFGVAEGGMSEAAAEQALGLLALFNGLGRISWGTLGQKIGPRLALMGLTVLQAAMLLALPMLAGSVAMLAFAGCWVGFMFGGNLSLFPLLTAERFGLRHLGGNYGLVFTGYGLGGVVGPLLAGGIWDTLHSYDWAFRAAAAASIGGGLLIALVAGDHRGAKAEGLTRPAAEPVGAGASA